ncbi:hypothetical protein [Nonomuraea typhae]|uniref:hypothetical protein n=1 Tax=Nonomuraea typhae TaxID=2603600 RepID=UPI0012FB1848|nr:hypothetical protein [Nonomuraea typhae]
MAADLLFQVGPVLVIVIGVVMAWRLVIDPVILTLPWKSGPKELRLGQLLATGLVERPGRAGRSRTSASP